MGLALVGRDQALDERALNPLDAQRAVAVPDWRSGTGRNIYGMVRPLDSIGRVVGVDLNRAMR